MEERPRSKHPGEMTEAEIKEAITPEVRQTMHKHLDSILDQKRPGLVWMLDIDEKDAEEEKQHCQGHMMVYHMSPVELAINFIRQLGMSKRDRITVMTAILSDEWEPPGFKMTGTVEYD